MTMTAIATPVGTTTGRYSLAEARHLAGYDTQRQLAEASGIAVGTISGIESGSTQHATHEGVAWALADALACDVAELRWEYGLTSVGRPPHTGKEITAHSSRETELCMGCFTEKSLSGECAC